MKIWLDDERSMPKGYNYHAHTAQEAVDFLAAGGVTAISLDHDLGDEQNGTGYEVACFIEDGAFHGTLLPIVVSIHSANPVGRDRMEQAICHAKKYWKRSVGSIQYNNSSVN
jgi:hypothetical protein